MPLLKKQSPELRKFRVALAPVESARHHLQHLRSRKELLTNDEIEYPLLGFPAWTNGDAAFTVAFSQPTQNMNQASIAFDVVNQRWTAKHEYRVKDLWVNLDEVLKQMQDTFNWITSKVKFSDSEFAELKWGKTLGVGFRMTITQTPAPNLEASEQNRLSVTT